MKKKLFFLLAACGATVYYANAQDANLQAGQQALGSKNYQLALSSFTAYTNSFNHLLSAYYKEQTGYDTSNQYMRDTHYANFKVNHPWATGYYGLGMANLNVGQKDTALADFETAEKIDPTYAEPYFQSGLLKKEKGDKTGACMDIGRAMGYGDTAKEVKKAYIDNFCWMTGMQYFKQGMTNLDVKDYTHALKNFQLATTICPDSANYWVYTGMAYNGAGKTDLAAEALAKAIKIDSTNYLAYYTQGVIYQNGQKYKEAFAALTKAIALSPRDVKAYIHRAAVCEGMDNESSAVYDYKQIIRINPDYGQAYYQIALYQQKLGKDACAYFKKAAALGVDDAQPYVDDCNKAADQLQR